MKISSIIVTGLFAGIAGAIAGTLFAPGKGTKTRNRIADIGQEYKDYLLDNYNDLAESVSHPFEDMEDQTIRLSKKAINKAKKMKKDVNNEVNQKLN